jgi:hypothetical protein
VSISNKTRPKEKTSDFLLYRPDRVTSGARYRGLPFFDVLTAPSGYVCSCDGGMSANKSTQESRRRRRRRRKEVTSAHVTSTAMPKSAKQALM